MNLRCWKSENLRTWQFEMSEAELTRSEWHDFADLQSEFAVDMKSEVVQEIVKCSSGLMKIDVGPMPRDP